MSFFKLSEKAETLKKVEAVITELNQMESDFNIVLLNPKFIYNKHYISCSRKGGKLILDLDYVVFCGPHNESGHMEAGNDKI